MSYQHKQSVQPNIRPHSYSDGCIGEPGIEPPTFPGSRWPALPPESLAGLWVWVRLLKKLAYPFPSVRGLWCLWSSLECVWAHVVHEEGHCKVQSTNCMTLRGLTDLCHPSPKHLCCSSNRWQHIFLHLLLRCTEKRKIWWCEDSFKRGRSTWTLIKATSRNAPVT